MNVQGFLERLPSFTGYLSVNELDIRSRRLAADYPRLVQLMPMGRSRSGADLLCLRIGEGSVRIVIVGCPHPNEPPGASAICAVASLTGIDREKVFTIG